jgi:hypothetical protein
MDLEKYINEVDPKNQIEKSYFSDDGIEIGDLVTAKIASDGFWILGRIKDYAEKDRFMVEDEDILGNLNKSLRK